MHPIITVQKIKRFLRLSLVIPEFEIVHEDIFVKCVENFHCEPTRTMKELLEFTKEALYFRLKIKHQSAIRQSPFTYH
jgi:hypothetical protein